MKNLVVDLDGTLILTDMLQETALNVIKRNPLFLFLCFWWLLKGKANLKKELANRSNIEVSTLPFNHELIKWLLIKKNEGVVLILATASDSKIANDVANFLGFFDIVIASDGKQNVDGKNKEKFLIDMFGQHNFDYVGNSRVDLLVWRSCKNAILVNCSELLQIKASTLTAIKKTFSSKFSIFEVVKIFRPHQWVKNILIFVPLVAAHQWGSVDSLLAVAKSFFAFGLTASAVYVLNDMIDLDNDRQHPSKRHRPFASGSVSLVIGVVSIPALLLISFLVGSSIPGYFVIWLEIYFIVSCIYSLTIKKIILIDCLTLAILYTLRLVSGASAASISISYWLLSFSVFLFFSLAFLKRYSELQILHLAGKDKTIGRGYHTQDIPIIQMMGIAAGFSSVLVFSLYINSEAIRELYEKYEIIWLELPLLIYWISWIWLKAHRGEVHDDPIVFALKDRVSLIVASLFILTFVVAM